MGDCAKKTTYLVGSDGSDNDEFMSGGSNRRDFLGPCKSAVL